MCLVVNEYLEKKLLESALADMAKVVHEVGLLYKNVCLTDEELQRFCDELNWELRDCMCGKAVPENFVMPIFDIGIDESRRGALLIPRNATAGAVAEVFTRSRQ